MAKKRDYYEVLGLTKTSDDKEIKKAYRKLAMKYHPDVSKEKDAEEKMKELNEAYEILSDENKRKIYDSYGHEAANNQQSSGGNPFDGFNGFGGFGGFEDMGGFGTIFEQFFGGRSGGRSSGVSKGDSYSLDVRITFLQSVLGSEIDQSLNHYENCKTCQAKGYEKDEDVKTCSNCNGTGSVTKLTKSIFGSFQQSNICTKCRGEGKEIIKKCSKCSGKKTIKSIKNIKIKIPSGILSGQELIVKGYGGPGKNGGANGDLFIKVVVEKHQFYNRVNNDIYLELPISIKDVILEKNVIVPTPWGEETIKIKSSYTNDLVVTLKNHGVRIGSIRGDLKVILKFVIPPFSKKELKKLIDVLDNVEDKTNSNFVKKF